MNTSHTQSSIDLLSVREMETLSLLLRGLNEQAISERLGLSKQTVHVYVKNLYRSFRVRDKGQLLTLFISPETITYIDAKYAMMKAQPRPERAMALPRTVLGPG